MDFRWISGLPCRSSLLCAILLCFAADRLSWMSDFSLPRVAVYVDAGLILPLSFTQLTLWNFFVLCFLLHVMNLLFCFYLSYGSGGNKFNATVAIRTPARRCTRRKKSCRAFSSIRRGVSLENCFDSSCGFPGEGPNQWSLLTANVNSMSTNHMWKTWTDPLICLQETRVGKNNHRSMSFKVKEQGKQLFTGALLPGLQIANGKHRTQHGGTAILAPAATTLEFSPMLDATGKYAKLFETKRVVAVWHQVASHLRVLVWSIYAKTGANSDPAAYEFNDALFEDVFLVSAQFGNIPVIVTGDFQAEPVHYHAISRAVNFLSWVDPLLKADDFGDFQRPITFSKDGCFLGLGEGCSSIDGILLNQAAFCALQDITVLELFGVQHRPVRASFSWDKIFQNGHILQLPALIDVTKIPKPSQQNEFQVYDQNAQTIWESSFLPQFENASNHEEQWQIVNNSLLETLLQAGAKWETGQQKRGQEPTFLSKQFCPGQLPSMGATSVQGSRMKNCLNQLYELRIRLERLPRSTQDSHTTRRTAIKTWWNLRRLKSPFLWAFPEAPTLVDVFSNITWLFNKFKWWEEQKKLERIRTWQNKVRASSKSNCSFIYHHLRNKIKDEPANLVTTSEGHILYEPVAALRHINETWDTVFSANCLHEHPLKVLEVIWPYIQNETSQASVPDVSYQDLYDTVQRRKPLAAAGLDGWRTHELQSLPPRAFSAVAYFFRSLEDSDQPVPQILATTKQQILNKNGQSEPLQKRLITLLPALFLAYTGTRFKQLQSWQQTIMPNQMLGAIKNRHMTTIPTTLRLQIDEAHADGFDLVGLKLDKAKCFDRILPNVTAALFLAFGLPKTITNVFVKFYQSLKRHLAYKGWASPRPTTACNGVAQGCSMSLVAINVHMKVWISLLEHLPTISVRAFIDDAYLWSRLQNIADLETAIKITQTWDLLCGQLLNGHKSIAWGTSTAARKAMRMSFPSMQLLYEVDVLGSIIYTSKRNSCAFPVQKAVMIQQEAKTIAALPVDRNTKAKIIGTRLIPRCTYTAHISQIPQTVQSKISAAVAASLWYKRPPWRSKWLVLGLLAQPHRIEPELARAYTAICDFSRFIHMSPDFVPLCQKTLATCHDLPHSLLSQVRAAFSLFGLTLHDDFCVSFRCSQRVPLLDLPTSQLRKLLQQLARHVCYIRGCERKRKDTNTPKGILDFDLTCTFWKKSKLKFDEGLPATHCFESLVVGCSITNDRLCAAGLTQTDRCRFCQQEQENLPHLLQCFDVFHMFGTPTNHELGENFLNLGIIEHPPKIIEHRLQFSSTEQIPVADFTDPDVTTLLWTDGSLQWSNYFWLCAGGFAVCDQLGTCLAAGAVHCWNITSYSTELWALIIAVAVSSTSVHIFSDCRSVVDHFLQLDQLQDIPQSWPHRPWWLFLHKLVSQRRMVHSQAVQVDWVPAHLFEHMPVELISEELAAAKGTTRLHIFCNRVVDLRAKHEAVENSAIDPKLREWLLKAILSHQEWLTTLHKNLTSDEFALQQNSIQDEETLIPGPEDSVEKHRSCFPKWPWQSILAHYGWKPKIPRGMVSPHRSFAQTDWDIFVRFSESLRWQSEPSSCVAFVELAAVFHFRRFRFNDYCDENTTFKKLTSRIRKAYQIVSSLENASFFPGSIRADKRKSLGRALPTGVIDGTAVFLSDEELCFFSRILREGAGRQLASWDLPVGEFLM